MSEIDRLKKLKLGDLLIEHQIIRSEDLEHALVLQSQSGKKLGDVLVEQGLISETELLLFLAKQLHMPFLELPYYRIKPEVIREIPESMARRLKMIPIDRIQNRFLVAVCDPTDLYGYDEIAKKLKKPMMLVLVREQAMMRAINEVFRKTQEIASLVGEIEQEMTGANQAHDMEEEIGEAPIKKLLNSIFEDAIQMNASDIHLEPADQGLRIRQRVDGVLQEQIVNGKNIIAALILRLKLMAKLDISERRLPQDGRFTMIAKSHKIDVRMSTIPLDNGESVVLRLLHQTHNQFKLDDLGMSTEMLNILKGYLHRPHGMILVTGPTGSGKSTTLYASLLYLNCQEKKIITVEDPVEYSFDRINQIQIQPKIGLDFAQVLRSILRHDPDILMIGEIRDEETAKMALRSAITGHLILSTLHTFDAITGPIRLLDMGVEPYLAASALGLVIAQRLVRKNCPSCSEPHAVTSHERQWLSQFAPSMMDHCFVQGKGCTQCQMRGYRGRLGIFEFLEMNEALATALSNQDYALYNQLAKSQPTYQPMLASALALAKEGIISLNEIIRLGADASP